MIDISALLGNIGAVFGGLIILMMIISAAIKIVPEYKRLVIFRLGRLAGSRGPGIIFLIPVKIGRASCRERV